MGKNKGKKQLSHGIPEKFLQKLAEMFGSSLANQLGQTFVARPTTFRINTIKVKKTVFTYPDYNDKEKKYRPVGDKEEVINILNENGFKLERVPWYKDAFVLKSKTKREMTDLDIYGEGKIYIQSLASMVPPLVLDPKAGEKVLDLTAAPGSKTSQIAALMERRGELVANDNNKIRFFKLKHNMELLGVVNTKEDIDDWKFTLRMEYGAVLCQEYPEYFDKILLDAPCSAETRFIEGEPKTYGYWKEQKVKEMAYKQRQLILAAWSALKPGGVLVYSTCTFSPEENELQIAKLMERVDDCELLDIDMSDLRRLPIIKVWPPVSQVNEERKNREINKEIIKKALRIMPTKDIEGFFVVKMRKKIIE